MPPAPPSRDPHLVESPSPWVVKWSSLIRARGRVLDLACGAGRHALFLARQGFSVEAVDRDVSLLRAQVDELPITVREADLENAPWPYASVQFDGIVVTNYLWRPLFAAIFDALDSGGVLVYETFAVGNERFGKPSNPDFLLEHGELLELVRGQLRVVAYEDVFEEQPKPAMKQRIVAVAP